MRKKRAVIYVVMISITVLSLLGCGAEMNADVSSYGDDKVVFYGLPGGEVTLTVSQLADMKCTNKTVTTQSRKGEITVEVSGPSLKEIMKRGNCEITDIESMKVCAKDGYTAVFDSDFLALHDEMIFSLANGKEPLQEDETPVRLVIPGAPADRWVKGIVEIEFEIK